MSRRRILENTTWDLVGGAVTIIANLGTLLTLTNGLGDEKFGLVSGVMALLLMIGPFSGLGAGHLIVRAVNQEGLKLPVALGRFVLLAPLGGALCFVVLIALQRLILPQSPLGLLVAMGVAELLFNPLIRVVNQAAQAVERLWISAATEVTARVTRFVVALVYVKFAGGADPTVWGLLHMASMAAGAVVGFGLLRFWAGPIGMPRIPSRRDALEGLPFGIGAGALFVRTESDKYLLLRFGLDSEAGEYTAGYRVLTTVMFPIRALVNATYARFFRTTTDDDSLGLVRRLTLVGELYAVIVGLAMWLTAPILPDLLGPGFGEVVGVVRWLSVVPMLIVASTFAGQALTGTGRNTLRVRLIVVASVGNVLANLVLIPAFGITGALASTIAAEAALSVAVWVALTTTTSTAPTSQPQD